MMKIALLAAMSLASTSVIQAADTETKSSVYIGGTVGEALYKEQSLPTVTPFTAGMIVGWQANANFAVEMRLGANLASDTTTLPHANLLNSKLDLEVEHYESLYLKGLLPATGRFSLFGMIGFTTAKLRAHAGNGMYRAWATTSDSSLSGAIGGEFSVGKQSSLSAEWGRLLNGDGYRVDEISIAYRYHFK